MSQPVTGQALFRRLNEAARERIGFTLDGQALHALQGDTIMTAILTQQSHLRHSEFGATARAGFCLMGACQDCWVWTPAGERLRACSTPAEAGMELLTRPPAHHWPVTLDLQETLARHAPEAAA
jgi:predicted molibdopterin-dependent oxidoreductase YjgC